MSDAGVRDCPVCGGSERRRLFDQRFEAPRRGVVIRGYSVVACHRCGFVYADGIPTQALLDDHYREQSKYEYADGDGAERPADRLRFNRVADRIVDAFPDRAVRILEIGSSTGGFLAILRSRGFHELLGSDPSPRCVEAALRIHGERIVAASLADLTPVEGTFGLIVLLAVLEHVRDLAGALARVAPLLQPAGALYVEVPDASRFLDTVDAPYQQFSTEHINYFTPGSLRNLMRVGGLQEVFSDADTVRDAFVVTPAIEALFRRSDLPAPPLEPDTAGAQTVTQYVQRCDLEQERLHERLVDIARRHEVVIVWGAGTHTQHLLAAGAFDAVEIAAFVDSNPHLQGSTLRGKPILGPQQLAGMPQAILVSSRGFQHEIVAQARDELKLPNELLTLY